jgi:hypothetical protein
MTEESGFDLGMAHRFFSAECFNRAWELIDLPARTPEQERTMLQLGIASLWHWSERPDRTPTNLSAGYWQVSRIYALLGQAQEAHRYGELCLEIAQGNDLAPFYRAYACEALARAEAVARDRPKRDAWLQQARDLSNKITDAGERKQLLTDLSTIQ